LFNVSESTRKTAFSTRETISAPAPSFINLETVRHLYCGDFTGTGSIIDQDRILTANHVTAALAECRDASTGEMGKVVYRNPDLDISVIQFPVGKLPQPRMRYSCQGFVDGHIYYSIGWQNGTQLVVNRITGTDVISDRKDHKSGTMFNHVTLVLGTIIPGMSGGPIIDEAGVMVGTNQATNHDGRSWSRPISDTYLCD
jgi:S1-C subfamily serine protease